MDSHEQRTILKGRNFPTGIILLDRRLDGGLPEGSMVCVHASPVAMPEAFFYQFSTVAKCYYFNTSRPSKYILRDMHLMGIEPNDVEFIDVYSHYYLNEYGQFIVEDRYRDKEIFDFVDAQLGRILEEGEDDFILIFDSLSFFLKLNVEWGLKEWMLNKIYSITKETGNISYLYLLKDAHPPDVINKVLDMCDVIFDIIAEKIGEKIVSKVAIPKIRGGKAITEYFRYFVEEGVQIDTSRDIA
jgi:archaellum biogenesis ATPase FlaH